MAIHNATIRSETRDGRTIWIGECDAVAPSINYGPGCDIKFPFIAETHDAVVKQITDALVALDGEGELRLFRA